MAVRIEKGRHKKVNGATPDASSEVQPPEWNDDHNEDGIDVQGNTASTLATGAFLHSNTVHTIAAQSGTADDLDTITATDSEQHDRIALYADTGDTITVTTAGNIITRSGGSIVLSETVPTIFYYDGTNWHEYKEGQVVLYTVAANDAPQSFKNHADYLCSGSGDEVEIKAAIDAATAAAGGKVLLSEGTFNVDAAIAPKANVWIQGSGWGTILKATSAVSIFVNSTAISADNVIISDLKIDGNRALPNTSRGINIENDNVQLRSLLIVDTGSHSAVLREGDNQSIINCISKNSGGDAFKIGDPSAASTNAVISGCMVDDCDDTACLFANVTNGTITNCVAENCKSGYGSAGGINIAFTNCIASAGQIGNGSGVLMSDGDQDGDNWVISNCTFSKMGQHGIFVDGNAGSGMIINCRCLDNSQDMNGSGIKILTEKIVTVIGCDCSDNQGTPTQKDGIADTTTNPSCRLMFNRAVNNTDFQILITNAGDTEYTFQNIGYNDEFNVGTVPDVLHDGDIWLQSNTFKVRRNGGTENLITNSQAATMTSKILTSPVINGLAQINLNSRNAKTLSGGVIAATQTNHRITSQTGATDELDTATGGVDGDIMILSPTSGDTITITDVGNFVLAGDADFVMSDPDDRFVCQFNGSAWIEMSRSANHV